MHRPTVAATLAVATLLCLLAACASPPPLWVNHPLLGSQLTTRVPFRPEGTAIYSSPYLGLAQVIPAGTPAVVERYSSREVHVRLQGATYIMRPLDGEFSPNGVDTFVEKYFVRDPGELGLDAMDPSTRSSILTGYAVMGMTKQEALMALGIPVHIDQNTPTVNLPLGRILSSNRWVYRVNLIVFAPTARDYTFYEGRLTGQSGA